MKKKRTNLSYLRDTYEVGSLMKVTCDRTPDPGDGQRSLVRKGTLCIILGIAWDPSEPMLSSVSYEVFIAGFGHYIFNHFAMCKVL